MRTPVVATVGTLLLMGLTLAGVQSDAGACTIDGIPSISANGRLAVRNGVAPTAQTVQYWAPFIFSQPFRPGQPIVLREDRAKLQGVLKLQVLDTRWRWALGDGRTAVGQTVTLRYSRAGHYRIVVSAYFRSYTTWLPFDTVALTVHT